MSHSLPDPLPLDAILAADRGRLIALDKKRRELARARKPHDAIDAQFSAAWQAAVARSAARKERHAELASPEFDNALPIAEKRRDIAKLIQSRQVVIVCGETGSGKTTQLPKICLELGRGIHGMIGCSQPRRIAARTLASRLAQELKQTGRHTVGYKIRFNDHTSDETFLKVMTDGILLAETHSDRNLWQYDTLIIDEAHERSLNIDFLLGYVKRLLPRRPDLKVIITSATIDPQRFSKHFDNAPIIEVSGRTFPVEIRYRPEHFLDEAEDAIPIEEAVSKAVDEIAAESHDGDILVFLPGEREIRDTAEALRKHHPQHTEILPLFSRLSNAEQDKVFHPAGRRRIVLATNVAETSLTVPGIRYVIDTGVARIHRYSARQKIDMLQIEPIAQASAKQRAGRCGRVAAGICIRLYAELDHNARPAFTTPEILRTSLASVILRMKSLGLGEVEDFPFVEPPGPRMIEDGYRQLFELGATDEAKNLTPLGWQLAKFPIDPALARMLVAGEKEAVLKELLIIASALSVQDPRDRPMDKQQQFTLAHEKFAHPQSEFAAYLRMWEFYEEAWKHKQSNRKFEQVLRDSFLSPLRMREWRDLHAQLREMVESLGMHLAARAAVAVKTPESPAVRKTAADATAEMSRATYHSVHRALLTGLISNVGTKAIEGDHYLGTRGLKFQLPKRAREHAQQKKERMKWVMAAELTETTRVYARTIASIEPEWIEELAAHLVTRTHFEPHWERKSGQVVAFEQVSLFGLVVNPRRRVHYGAINPVEAREIFIRQGLVAGEVDTRGAFLRHNLKMVGEIEDIEAKARRQDVLVDDEDMFALYDAVIPADVVNMAGFEKWRREHEKNDARALEFTREQLMRRHAQEITFDLFPKQLKHKGAAYPLTYRFEPGHTMDGVTIALPVAVLNQVNGARFEWLVMGMLRDKVAAVIKTLPQRFRSPLVPVPEFVSDFIGHVTSATGMNDLSAAETPLIDALTRYIKSAKGVDIAADAWDATLAGGRVAPHLFMNFRIVDGDGKELAMSRDFAALREQYAEASRTVFSTLHRNRMEREGLTEWPDDVAEIPETINFEKAGIRYDGFPALVDGGSTVAIRIFDDAQAATLSHTQGLTRLAMLALAEQVRFCERSIKVSPVAAFQFSTFFAETKNHAQEALRQELLFAAFRAAIIDADGGTMRSREGFLARLQARKNGILQQADALTRAVDEALTLVAEVKKRLEDRYLKGWEHLAPDIDGQLRQLFAPRFMRETAAAQLLHYPRYLKAAVMRLDKAKLGAMERDLEHSVAIRPLWQNYLQAKVKTTPEMVQYRWLVEELRVGLYAQELRTPMPVSIKRLGKMWADLQATS